MDRNEPLMDERMATDASPRREPFPGQGYLWLIWHWIRFHHVAQWGWSISRSGSRRNWLCLRCHRTWR